MRNENSLRDALTYIPSDDYQTWITVLAALKNEVLIGELDEAAAMDIAMDWSSKSPKFDPPELWKKWNSLQNKPDTLATCGSVYELAKQYGYTKSSHGSSSTSALSMGVPIIINDDDNNSATATATSLDTLQGRAQHLIAYLRAMYKPTDYIRILTQTEYIPDKDKWGPSGQGKYAYTVGQIIEKINSHLHEDKPTLLGMDLGQLGNGTSYNHDVGGWICVNPLDGKGVSNNNVKQYRYALLESDEQSKQKQLEYIKRLNLPYKAIIDSGNKSIHCILLINADNYHEYQERVDYIYNLCQKNGFAVDKSGRNPSRLCRLPGLIRGKNMQRCLEIRNDACIQSFEEWQAGLVIGTPVEMSSAMASFDPKRDLSPVIIEGILRKGRKMLLVGSSKAGKTSALIELAMALATGGKWLGFQCHQSKVLYINMEIDGNYFTYKCIQVLNALGIPVDNFASKYANNFYKKDLRGITLSLSKLIDLLIPLAKSYSIDAVIIDPIYKLMDGDENASKDVGPLVNQFDRLANATGASVIYSHHYTKGSAYNNSLKSVADRASGSGVFGRDADAVVTMTQLHYDAPAPMPGKGPITAWKIDSCLREFPPFGDANVFFAYPLHKLDTDHILDDAKYEGDVTVRRGERRGEQLAEEKEERIDKVYNYLYARLHYQTSKDDTVINGKSAVKTKSVERALGLSQSTINRYINKSLDFMFAKDGRVSYIVARDGK